jgi:predicted RNase H-like nuclease (RuvC/YqgF family)
MPIHKKLIIGIDPGTTCGVAALDLGGGLLHLESRRGFSRSEIVGLALSLGDPVVVASDVNPPSAQVKKLASSLNSALYVPEPMSSEKKGTLVRIYIEENKVNPANPHERDALAAAVKAYLHYKNKLQQVETKVQDLNVSLPIEEVKALVLRGNSIQNSIEITLSTLQKPEPSPEPPKPAPRRTVKEQLIDRLRDRIRRQKAQISRIRQKNDELIRLLSETRTQLDELTEENEHLRQKEDSEIRRERRYLALHNEIVSLRKTSRSLQEQLQNSQKRLDSIMEDRIREIVGKAVLLKPIENFTAVGLEKAHKYHRITPGDMVLLQDASGGGASTARRLAKLGVSLVVASTEIAHQAKTVLKSQNIPIIPSQNLKIKWVEGYPYISPEDLEEKIKEQKASEIDLAQEEIETVISEYREEKKNKRS